MPTTMERVAGKKAQRATRKINARMFVLAINIPNL
jgi:hypothetical protein